MASIRHFPATHPLPDWRNVGVVLRTLLGVNALAALAALLLSNSLSAWPGLFMDVASFVEPVLLQAVGLLALLRDLLWRLPLRAGQAAVLGIVALLALLASIYAQSLGLADAGMIGRAVLLSLGASGLMLIYFELRSRAFSPVLAEARLAALNARIRPHFLFNSLNAVLSLVRARPQQAEMALEALSDLFRAAMRDPGELVRLADEIELGKQYLALEGLRLGERLAVDWQIEGISPEQPIPPLILQPLLENAVGHGIEPLPEGGVIRVEMTRQREYLRIAIDNPVLAQGAVVSGNRIALANIRERLSLYYDLAARLEIKESADHYHVEILLPCQAR
ncbi:MAG: histidine kinase [Azonexus sp.]|nr:histidine kinase [Azonexus sp.]